MRISIILFAFVVMALMVAGLMYVASTTTDTLPTDSYGSAPTETTNSTGALLETITNTGAAAGAGLLLLFGCLTVLAGLVMIRHYAR